MYVIHNVPVTVSTRSPSPAARLQPDRGAPPQPLLRSWRAVRCGAWASADCARFISRSLNQAAAEGLARGVGVGVRAMRTPSRPASRPARVIAHHGLTAHSARIIAHLVSHHRTCTRTSIFIHTARPPTRSVIPVPPPMPRRPAVQAIINHQSPIQAIHPIHATLPKNSNTPAARGGPAHDRMPLQHQRQRQRQRSSAAVPCPRRASCARAQRQRQRQCQRKCPIHPRHHPPYIHTP